MNPISRPLIRPLILTSAQASRLILASLILCVSLLGATSVTFAQPSPPDQASSAPTPAASTKKQNIRPTQTPQVTPASQIQQRTPRAQSDKDEFERVKEARLNELRYKHLWIAYSLVWLIVFIFIRGTWRRSQAVEQRIMDWMVQQSAVEQLMIGQTNSVDCTVDIICSSSTLNDCD